MLLRGLLSYNPKKFSTRGRSILFTNPMPVHKVWRSGTEYTGTITAPTGYTVSTWQIINKKTRSVVTSGSGTTVTATLSFGGTAVCNVHDLRVVITNGIKTFERIFHGEITVYPPLFTEATADLVINLNTESTNRDFNWATDRSGYKVWVKGTKTGRWNPYYLRALTATNPAHIIFEDAVINSSTFGFTPGPFQNVVIDGCRSESVPYGLIINKSTGNDQGLFFTGADGVNGSDNILIGGIEVAGAGSLVIGNGAAGMQFITSDSVNFNFTNYSFDNLYAHNLYSHDISGEGYYIGHFTDFDDDADGRFFAPFDGGMFFRCKSLNTGNDGFQMGQCYNTEVFHLDLRNCGTRNDASHRNGIQWSHGNRFCSCFCNYIETAGNIFSGFTGRYGKDNEFFSNVFVTSGRPSGGVNIFVRMDNNEEVSMYWGFFNNTIVASTGLPWSLYNATNGWSTVFNPMILADNFIATDTATQTEYVNGFVSTNVTLNNLQTTNINSIGLIDAASKNYKPSSLASSLYRTRTSFTKVHPLANYDYEGVKFDTDIVGAYSGYELSL